MCSFFAEMSLALSFLRRRTTFSFTNPCSLRAGGGSGVRARARKRYGCLFPEDGKRETMTGEGGNLGECMVSNKGEACRQLSDHCPASSRRPILAAWGRASHSDRLHGSRCGKRSLRRRTVLNHDERVGLDSNDCSGENFVLDRVRATRLMLLCMLSATGGTIRMRPQQVPMLVTHS